MVRLSGGLHLVEPSVVQDLKHDDAATAKSIVIKSGVE